MAYGGGTAPAAASGGVLNAKKLGSRKAKIGSARSRYGGSIPMSGLLPTSRASTPATGSGRDGASQVTQPKKTSIFGLPMDLFSFRDENDENKDGKNDKSSDANAGGEA